MRATLFAILTATLGLAACNDDDEHASCVVDGVTHPHGLDFPSADGCNTCQCDDGEVACTLRACVTTCSYDGQIHEVGTSFPSSDGCNTCTCTASGAVSCTQTPCVATCTYDGALFEVGDEFPSTDGCNTCTCAADGSVGCTEMACPQGCSYDGRTWESGDQFPADDGCNTCTCMAGGTIACTEKACACSADSEWWRHYESSDVVACGVLAYSCPGQASKFQNACGCGCEQSRECAKEIDCFDASCDFGAVEDACPYSAIDSVPDCSAEMPCAQFQCKSPGSGWGCGMCRNPPEETTCESDAACAPGSICQPLPCACQGQKMCVPGCTADDACGAGQHCAVGGRCEALACTAASCPPNFGCEAGFCARRVCSASATCDADGFCVNGACYGETGNCYPPLP